MTNWTIVNIPSLKDKHIIITGANSGLGYESAKVLASKGATIYMACRNAEKAESAIKSIKQENNSANLVAMSLDLGDLKSVKEFSEAFKNKSDKLDVLLNNAGIMAVPQSYTKDGFESQIGINHFGHFALTAHLIDLLKKTPNSRVVNVSSLAHKNGRMNFGDLHYQDGSPYSPMKAYGQSKLANLLFTQGLQKRFEEQNIDCIALSAHPGASMTNLGNHLHKKWYAGILMPLAKSVLAKPAQAAHSQIRACLDPNAKGNDYFGPSGFMEMSGKAKLVDMQSHAKSEADAERLWSISEELTNLSFSL